MAGASGRRTFFGIFIPLLTPAIFGATMYSFMTHLESLEIPLVIGLPAGDSRLSHLYLLHHPAVHASEYGLSAALGATFLLVSILLVYAYRYAMRQEGRFATITGKGYRTRLTALGKWRYAALGAFLLYFALTIAAPGFVLFWSSLLPVYMPPSWELLPDLTLEHYREVFPTATFSTPPSTPSLWPWEPPLSPCSFPSSSPGSSSGNASGEEPRSMPSRSFPMPFPE